jgi:hypothetical protein
MMRIRGPKYPSYSLNRAIENVKILAGTSINDGIHRSAAALNLGYNSLNGAATKSFGTMTQFGLLNTGVANCLELTILAKQIVLSSDNILRSEALLKSAESPPTFQAIFNNFGRGMLLSFDELQPYLLSLGYTDRSIKPIYVAYNETVTMLRAMGIFKDHY